jgi:hypothetical protein
MLQGTVSESENQPEGLTQNLGDSKTGVLSLVFIYDGWGWRNLKNELTVGLKRISAFI